MFKFFQNIFGRKNLLQEALESSWSMLRTDKEMFDASVKSLRQEETADVNVDIYKRDREINRLEQEVRKKVLTHLAVSGQTELASGLTLVSIISDIERVGDYTKNIYELAREHPRRLSGAEWEEEMKRSEHKVSESFEALIQALRESNADKAKLIISEMAEVKKMCDSLISTLLTTEQKFETQEAVALALYLRYLKRVAAHIQNVTSTIVKPFHLIKYQDE